MSDERLDAAPLAQLVARLIDFLEEEHSLHDSVEMVDAMVVVEVHFEGEDYRRQRVRWISLSDRDISELGMATRIKASIEQSGTPLIEEE